jgi:hypothetical protein
MYHHKDNKTHYKVMQRKGIYFFAFCTLFSSLMMFHSHCHAKTPTKQVVNFSQDASQHISQKQIELIFREYKYFFASTIQSSIDEIIKQNPNIGIRKALLRFEMHLMPAFRGLSEQEDPAIALLDVWTLAERMVHHLGNDAAKKQFQQFQPILLNAAKRNRDRILEIVKAMVPENCFDQGCDIIKGFAQENPIGDTYSNLLLHAPQPETKEKSAIDVILSLPGMLISPTEGIDRKIDDGVSAIREFTIVAGRFDRNVKELPESIRWQLLSFLYDLEEDQLIQSLNEKMAEISESHAKLSSTLESMPKQTEILIDHLAWRAVQLIILMFVSALIYRVLSSAIRKKAPKTT